MFYIFLGIFLIILLLIISNIKNYYKKFYKNFYKKRIRDQTVIFKNNLYIKQALYNFKIRLEENIIPLNVYQTYKTIQLPECMQEAHNILKKQNPEFKFHLYDDEMCEDFIKKNFDKDVLFAFHNLIPGAFKADLWRYCILYINGGIYVDIKFIIDENSPIKFMAISRFFFLFPRFEPKDITAFASFI